ncbi:MAG: MBL fold metallo-hydrolase [Anaerolineae bacterium]
MPERLYPGVWRLTANNPSPMTGPGSNTYLVGGATVAIVDPGPNLPEHLDAIEAALHRLNATAQAIIPTHPHHDHDGGSEALAARLNAPVLRFAAPLAHGDTIRAAGLALTVLHTPGHIHRHICLWLAEARLLFAGDLVAGAGTVLIIPPEGDMADYLASLRAMRALQPAAILPGHGPVQAQADAVLRQYLEHRLAREQQVLAAWRSGLTSAAAIAAHIYADRPRALPIATLQVEAHLHKLRQEGAI